MVFNPAEEVEDGLTGARTKARATVPPNDWDAEFANVDSTVDTDVEEPDMAGTPIAISNPIDKLEPDTHGVAILMVVYTICALICGRTNVDVDPAAVTRGAVCSMIGAATIEEEEITGISEGRKLATAATYPNELVCVNVAA
jgi:hypothetical protein